MTISPFVESDDPRLPPATANGIPTSEYDRFRSGVELQTDFQRFLGTYTVSAGSKESNEFEQYTIGWSSEYDEEATYTERDKFAPDAYVSSSLTLQPIEKDVNIAFPCQANGAIDIFATREYISLPNRPPLQTKPYAGPHGSLGHGNEDLVTGHADVIVNTIDFAETTSVRPYDEYNLGSVALNAAKAAYTGVPFLSASLVSGTMGWECNVSAFDETESFIIGKVTMATGSYAVLPRDVTIDQMLISMSNTPETCNHMLGVNEVSTTAGFDYVRPAKCYVIGTLGVEAGKMRQKIPNNVHVGTDSIAFGGMLQ